MRSLKRMLLCLTCLPACLSLYSASYTAEAAPADRATAPAQPATTPARRATAPAHRATVPVSVTAPTAPVARGPVSSARAHGDIAPRPAPAARAREDVDTHGPCDVSWLLTRDAAAAKVPAELDRQLRPIERRQRWAVPDLKALAARPAPADAVDAVTRSGHMLVLLVDYRDVAFSSAGLVPTATHEEWRRRVLGLTTGPDGALRFDRDQVSVHDFWNEASFGRVSLEPVPESFDGEAASRAVIDVPDAREDDGVVHVRIDLPPYQLGYYWPLRPVSEYTYMAAALREADRYVDFAALDTDRNGVVDRSELAIFMVFANPFQVDRHEWMWPHRFALPPNSLKLDGVSVAGGDPTINPVVTGGSYIAVDQYRHDRHMRHEYGHDLGLPDLYNVSIVDDNHNDGIGHWGAMATSWGLPEGWSRMHLGWVREDDGTLVRYAGQGSWDLEVPSISEGWLEPGMVVVVPRPGVPNEYFVLENRRRVGKYESMLDGEGLVIFHAFDNRLLYKMSATNLGTGKRLMGLRVVEADGSWDLLDPNDGDYGSPGDPYLPGDRFAPDTDPASSWYGDTPSGVYIDDLTIGDEGWTMGLRLCVGPACE